MTQYPQQILWKEQCRAAIEIDQHFGTIKALQYLIGEKLRTHLKLCTPTPLGLQYQDQLPHFIAQIRSQFSTDILARYFAEIDELNAVLREEEQQTWEALSEEERNAERENLEVPENTLMEDAQELLLQDHIKRLLGVS